MFIAFLHKFFLDDFVRLLEYTGENVYRPKKSRTNAGKKKSRPAILQNAKRRTAIVHSYDIDFIPLVVYNIKVVQEWRVIPMKYLSTFEVAEKWGHFHRRVGILCNENRIPGAQRAGGRWIIPENAEKACLMQESRAEKYQVKNKKD